MYHVTFCAKNSDRKYTIFVSGSTVFKLGLSFLAPFLTTLLSSEYFHESQGVIHIIPPERQPIYIHIQNHILRSILILKNTNSMGYIHDSTNHSQCHVLPESQLSCKPWSHRCSPCTVRGNVMHGVITPSQV